MLLSFAPKAWWRLDEPSVAIAYIRWKGSGIVSRPAEWAARLREWRKSDPRVRAAPSYSLQWGRDSRDPDVASLSNTGYFKV